MTIDLAALARLLPCAAPPVLVGGEALVYLRPHKTLPRTALAAAGLWVVMSGIDCTTGEARAYVRLMELEGLK